MNDLLRRIETKRHISYIKDKKDDILHQMRWRSR